MVVKESIWWADKNRISLFKLPPEQAALRAYTIYGKTNLTDKTWHSPTNEASRFFKVGVEMR